MHLSNFIIYSKYLTGRVCGFEERGYRDKNIRTAEMKLKFIKAILSSHKIRYQEEELINFTNLCLL